MMLGERPPRRGAGRRASRPRAPRPVVARCSDERMNACTQPTTAHAWIESSSATTSSSASTTCPRRRRARSRCASRTCGAIIDVLDAAYEEGIRTFMCTSHDRVAEICDHFRAHPERVPRLPASIPCMPYAHKYANAVTEHGMIEALRMFLPQEGAIAAMLKGGVALASKDIEAIMQLLIDAEMKMFHGLRDAGRLHAERHHRPAARPAHARVLPHLPRPRAGRATAPSRASSR